MKKNYLISTDLDGTFLGHENFDYKVNKIIVSKIAHKNIPIIFNRNIELEYNFDNSMARSRAIWIAPPL